MKDKKRKRSAAVSAAMSALGRVGALARAEALSAKRRREIATKASKAAARVRTAKAKKKHGGER